MKQNYAAIIERDDVCFGVHFPDFPGCVSSGDSYDEILKNAAEALQLHVRGMAEDGDPLPSPTAIDDIEPDPEAPAFSYVYVGVDVPGKAKRYNLSLDETLVGEVDSVTRNRSAFFADAAREKLDRLNT